MAKPRAKKKCIKGYACGYTCIKRGKVCRKNASTEAVETINSIVDIINNVAEPNASLASEAYMNDNVTLASLKAASKQIGKGAYGVAYLTPKGTLVKIPKAKELGTLEVKTSKLMGEAGFAPKILATGKVDGKDYVEMEYLQGYKPGFKVKRELFGEAQVAKIGEALAHLHNAGYVHNDVHMGNIMIHPKTGDVKLIDYGLATTAEPHWMLSDLNLNNMGLDWSDPAATELEWPAGSPQEKVFKTLYPNANSWPNEEQIKKALDVYLKQTK